jgi:hypothetical protein
LVRWQRAGVWKRLHRVLLADLRRRGQLDFARAIVDSASIRALRGGKKLDRTLPIAARAVSDCTPPVLNLGSNDNVVHGALQILRLQQEERLLSD